MIARCSKRTKAILPALVAVGGSLAAGQAGALELGELQVQSRLGQPLRASIAFVLGPNELIAASCVSVRSTGSGLPDASGTTISVANGIISLTGRNAVREPLITATKHSVLSSPGKTCLPRSSTWKKAVSWV